MDEKFIILHTPKCGGTSLSFELYEQYPEDLSYYYRRPEQNPIIFETIKSLKKNIFKEKKKIIFGHFNYYNFPRYLYSNYYYISFLRNPFDRAVSHYYYWTKNPDKKNRLCKKMIKNKWSLQEFIFHPKIIDFYSIYMPFNSYKKFDFFIILEKFSESLEILKSNFKTFQNVKYQKHNATSYETKDIHDCLKKDFMIKAKKDYEIYSYGLEVFNNFSKSKFQPN